MSVEIRGCCPQKMFNLGSKLRQESIIKLKKKKEKLMPVQAASILIQCKEGEITNIEYGAYVVNLVDSIIINKFL